MAIVAVASTITPAQEQRPYQPYGAALDLFYSQADEICIDGPAGTGKSRGDLEKLHFCAQKYKGMRGLIARKTRRSLTQTTLVTFQNHVLPVGSAVKFNTVNQEYRYTNGSVIAIAGLDDPAKVMSSEFDMIVVPEGTETTENDWDMLTTRLRNGMMPYQQIVADVNPQSPKHWLKQREKDGKLMMFHSRHEDNPILFNQTTGETTERGRKYLAKLDNLTGVRYLRLRKGLWVQAEGVIYEDYSDATHLIDRFDIPLDWERYWVVDFGYVNPFCWQEWAKDHDGNLYRVREIYHTKRLVEDHAKQILEVTKGSPRPKEIICDHDAEDRATLERHLGMRTVAAYKDVSTGIQAVQSRLRVQGNGKARLYLLRDSLVEVDRDLAESKKPLKLEDEIEEYIWSDKTAKEQPVKENDHACDAMRYVVAQIDLNKTESSGFQEFSFKVI